MSHGRKEGNDGGDGIWSSPRYQGMGWVILDEGLGGEMDPTGT